MKNRIATAFAAAVAAVAAVSSLADSPDSAESLAWFSESAETLENAVTNGGTTADGRWSNYEGQVEFADGLARLDADDATPLTYRPSFALTASNATVTLEVGFDSSRADLAALPVDDVQAAVTMTTNGEGRCVLAVADNGAWSIVPSETFGVDDPSAVLEVRVDFRYGADGDNRVDYSVRDGDAWVTLRADAVNPAGPARVSRAEFSGCGTFASFEGRRARQTYALAFDDALPDWVQAMDINGEPFTGGAYTAPEGSAVTVTVTAKPGWSAFPWWSVESLGQDYDFTGENFPFTAEFHDLIVTLGGEPALAEYDYFWSGDALYLTSDGLTVSGRTTNETITVLTGCADLTLRDLCIETSAETASLYATTSLRLDVVGEVAFTNTVASYPLMCSGSIDVGGTGCLSVWTEDNCSVYCTGDFTARDAVELDLWNVVGVGLFTFRNAVFATSGNVHIGNEAASEALLAYGNIEFRGPGKAMIESAEGVAVYGLSTLTVQPEALADAPEFRGGTAGLVLPQADALRLLGGGEMVGAADAQAADLLPATLVGVKTSDDALLYAAVVSDPRAGLALARLVTFVPGVNRFVASQTGVCSWSWHDSISNVLTRMQRGGFKGMQLGLSPWVWEDGSDRQLEFFGGMEGEDAFLTLYLSMYYGEIDIGATMICFSNEVYDTAESVKNTGGFFYGLAETAPQEMKDAADATWEVRSNQFVQAVERTALLGVGCLSCQVGYWSLDPEVGRERVSWAANLCATYGIRLLLESGQYSAAETAAFLEELTGDGLCLPESIGVNFDGASHLLYGTDNPTNAFEVLRPWIVQVHVKDCIEDPAARGADWMADVEWGRGDVSGRYDFIEYLRSRGYAGPLYVEHETGPADLDRRAAEIQTAVLAILRSGNAVDPEWRDSAWINPEVMQGQSEDYQVYAAMLAQGFDEVRAADVAVAQGGYDTLRKWADARHETPASLLPKDGVLAAAAIGADGPLDEDDVVIVKIGPATNDQTGEEAFAVWTKLGEGPFANGFNPNLLYTACRMTGSTGLGGFSEGSLELKAAWTDPGAGTLIQIVKPKQVEGADPEAFFFRASVQ